MPARTLPTFTRIEVKSHNCEKSCYVTIGDAVYDVTEFLQSHPGAADLVLKYAGHDVTNILSDPSSNPHSEVAYEILNEYLAGFVVAQNGLKCFAEKINVVSTKAEEEKPAGVSCEEDLSKETDFNNDYTTHKFLDLNRPLFPQVWFGGFSKEFYLDQVHRPRHYKDGKSAPVFGNFLEPFPLTPWWIVPTFWMPPVSYGVYISRSGLSSAVEQAGYLIFGFFLWSLIEYTLHRFLFHLDKYATLLTIDYISVNVCFRWLPDNRVAITLHFLLHGIHHYLPIDKYRLVMPPAVFIILASPF